MISTLPGAEYYNKGFLGRSEREGRGINSWKTNSSAVRSGNQR